MDFKWFAKQASTRLAKVSERLNALLDELAGDVPEDLSHPNAMDALDPSVNASVIEFAEGLADHPNTFSMPLNTNQGWLTSCMQIVINCFMLDACANRSGHVSIDKGARVACSVRNRKLCHGDGFGSQSFVSMMCVLRSQYDLEQVTRSVFASIHDLPSHSQ